MKHIKKFDLEQHAGALPSPCINVCRMDQESGLCIGCLRNIDEIIAWGRADETYKRQVWQQLKTRISK
ncbi:MAG: DUF1289 domain-containing protein [Burkholderiales bacterium]|nr:DUF1289 domain-containing protein [Burkholderiales bacterium]